MGIVAGNVVGGIGKPKFVIPDEEKCTNRTFIDGDTTGWNDDDIGTPDTLSIDTDEPNFYGDYSAEANDTDSNVRFIRYTTTAGGINLKSDTMLLVFEYKVVLGNKLTVKIQDNFEAHLIQAFTLTVNDNEWHRYARILITDTGAIPGNMTVRFYPTDQNPVSTGRIRITNLSIRKRLTTVLQLSQYPSKQTLAYETVDQYNHQTYLGRKHARVGWEPMYEAYWQLMTQADEIQRQTLMGKTEFFVFPHDDVYWGFNANWDEELTIEWAKNKGVGHEGMILARGIELFETKQFDFD